MIRLIQLFFVSAYVLLTMNKAWGDDGALPRGKSPAPGQKLIVPDQVSTPDLVNCMSYTANPEAAEFFFTEDGKLLYFLSRQTGEIKPEGMGFLYEVDLDNFRKKRIVSLKIGDNTAIVGHGAPTEAITLLDFHKSHIGCGEGAAAGVGVKWLGKQKIIKSYPQGNYKIVPTDHGPIVADMEQRNIKILDLNSFQKRTITSFPEKFYPLFLRRAPLQLFGFKPEQNELLRFDGNELEPSAVLKLKKGMRLVQDLDQFGIITSENGGKVLQLKQIKGWSGNAFRSIDIRLPDGFSADRLGVNIDFDSGLSLVQGANQALRRELRQLLIHNAAKGQIDRVLKAPETQYFSQAVFAQKGSKIVVLSRSLQDDSAQVLSIGDVSSGDWRELPVSREAEKAMPEKAANEKPVDKTAADQSLERQADQDKVPEKLEKPARTEKKLVD